MTPSQQDAVLREIGSIIVKAAPNDWEEVRFEYDALATVSTASCEAVYSDGRRQWINPPESACKRMDELRSGMHQPGKGTWYSVAYVASRPGRYNVEYNYDKEPNFDFPPATKDFVLDLQYFPRDDEHIPDWLRQKLQGTEK